MRASDHLGQGPSGLRLRLPSRSSWHTRPIPQTRCADVAGASSQVLAVGKTAGSVWSSGQTAARPGTRLPVPHAPLLLCFNPSVRTVFHSR